MFRPINNGDWHEWARGLHNPPEYRPYDHDAGNDAGDWTDVYPPSMGIADATLNTLVCEFHKDFDNVMGQWLTLSVLGLPVEDAEHIDLEVRQGVRMAFDLPHEEFGYRLEWEAERYLSLFD